MKNKISPLDLSSLHDFLPQAEGGIHINPANKGKFNALKKRTGKTTEELTHSKNPLTRKRAIFAQNAAKWHHADDGDIISPTSVNNTNEGGLQTYSGGIEKTPTGQVNAFGNNDFGLTSKSLNDYAKKYNLPNSSNKDFQKAQLEMLNSTPYGRSLIQQMNEKFGQTKAGTYADGLLGARTRYLIENYNPPSNDNQGSLPVPIKNSNPPIQSYPQPSNYFVNVRGEGDANANHDGAYYFVKDAATLKKIQDSGVNIHSSQYAYDNGSVNYDMPDNTFREQIGKNKDVSSLLGDAYIRNPKNSKEFIKKSDYEKINAKKFDDGGITENDPTKPNKNGLTLLQKIDGKFGKTNSANYSDGILGARTKYLIKNYNSPNDNKQTITPIQNTNTQNTDDFNSNHDLPNVQVSNFSNKHVNADLIFTNHDGSPFYKNMTIPDRATEMGKVVDQLPNNPSLTQNDIINTQKQPKNNNALLFGVEAASALMSFIPQERINDRYLRPEESMINPLYGTGSQAIADSGAVIPGMTGNLYGKATSTAKKRKAADGDTVKQGKEMLKQKMEYVSSPLYKKRLIEQGVKNPDEVIANRLTALKNVNINPPKPNSQTTTYTKTDANNKNQQSDIFLSNDANRYDLAHEIGHVTTGGSEYIPTYGANNTVGTQISPIEDWRFYNRNKSLDVPDSNFPGKTKRQVAYEMYTHGDNKFGNPYDSDSLHNIAANNLYEVSKGQMDSHNITSRENKSDLDSIRQLFYDNKITKNFGDNISNEDLEKAKKNKKILNEPHFKRFMSNFDDNSLIYLNNNIASNQNNNQNDIQMADNGAQVIPTSTITNDITPLWGGNPEQMSNNPYDGGTIHFSGDSHENGGVGIVYHGNPVEVEGGETGIVDKAGSLNIMGNMYVPGTKTKFKSISKKIAEAENSANNQFDKSLKLIEDADPNYYMDSLKANSSLMMKRGADVKQKILSDQKESLVHLQNAMLDTANEFGIDAQEMSKGNIKPVTMKKIKKAADGMGDLMPLIGKYKKQLFPISNDNEKLNNYQNHLLLGNLEGNQGVQPANSSDNSYPKSGNVQNMPGQNDSKFGNITNAENLNPLQLLGEAYAFGTNRVLTTPYQRYSPTLLTPVNYSFQDQLNENEASLKGVQKQLAYNPEALAILKGQEYQTNNSVLANEFRTNQQEYNAVRNKNTEILNDAKLKNLQMDDTNAVRKVQAISNTRRENVDILDSISSRFLQNALESKKLKAYENLYPNYRFNPDTGRLELVNANQDFSNLGVSGSNGQSNNGKKYVTTDAQGNVKTVKTIYNDPTTQNINRNREVLTGVKARQATLSGMRPLYKDGGSIVKKSKFLK